MCEKPSDFFIAWADPCVAASYRASDLSARDSQRASLPRSAKAQRDWQVSRALLHSVRSATPAARALVQRVLSHKHGHAVCAVAPAHWRVGVDLERIEPRDAMRLADWVCTPQERRMLADLDEPRRLVHFYLLWTLKEAFVKAADLAFPAGMARVGLVASEAGSLALQAPPGPWQACAWQLAPDWLVSVVWQPAATQNPPTDCPSWRSPATCTLPPRLVLGQWQTARGAHLV